ncbi:unnamed protein product [Protopolystoma xenopodis]|uniref:Uncharacterized protein n=1 Tax=Protopolystoma xenopodis TaxID=117903 RepID=A0A448WL01_9PLAT|nr:unnamed protein product [Protopolystoma xenopodis]
MVLRMARLTDDGGETSGNVPRPQSYSVNDDAYNVLRTSYRIVAVDHDLVSFVDTNLISEQKNTSDIQMLKPKVGVVEGPHTEFPLVLITNPKRADLLMPHKEPTSLIATSTHIR